MNTAATKNILIIKIAAIGDLLLITPAVRALRRAYPEAKISLLVGRWSKPIIEGNPDIDEIIEVDDSLFFRFRPWALLGLVWTLRWRRFDLALVWHRSLAFRFFAWLLGIPRRIGFSRNGSNCFLTDSVPEDSSVHEIYEYQKTLEPLGIRAVETEMVLTLPKLAKHYAEELWKKNGWENSTFVVGVAPGGGKNPKESMPLRHWPTEYYAELINLLTRNFDVKIVLLGGKDDCLITKKIEEQLSAKSVNLAGQTSLKELAAVISRCRLLIANDSSPMHIAAALKVPVISFFGPTDPKEIAPLGTTNYSFYAGLPCSPCYRNGVWPECRSKACLTGIKPEEVFKEIKKRISFS